MPLFLDTRGKTTLAVGICGRCGIKMSLDDLYDDANFPGLRVCADDLDKIDGYRLPAREADNLTVDQPRPDVAFSSSAQTPTFLGVMAIFGIIEAGPISPWQPSTNYALGNAVTPISENDPTVLPQYWFLCVGAGLSGLAAPVWATKAGVLTMAGAGPVVPLVSDSGVPLTDDQGDPLIFMPGTDGTVSWLCMGILPI